MPWFVEEEFRVFSAAIAAHDNNNVPATRKAVKNTALKIDIQLRQYEKVAPNGLEEGYFQWIELCHIRRLAAENLEVAKATKISMDTANALTKVTHNKV